MTTLGRPSAGDPRGPRRPGAPGDPRGPGGPKGPNAADLPPTRRHSLHRAAAETTGGDSVWLHRVAAATSVDESLAADLEGAALVATPAGADRPGPAQLWQWASDLSGDQAGRERRLLASAIHRICAGESGPAALWRRVEACPPCALRSCALSGRALLEGRPLEAEYHLDRAFAQPSEQPDWVAAIGHGLRAALRLDAALGQQTVDEAMAGLAACDQDRDLTRWLTRLLAAGHCYASGPAKALDTLVDETGAERPAADRREPLTLLALACYRTLGGELAGAITDLSELLAASDRPLPPTVEMHGRQWLALACQLAGAWREASHQARSAMAAAKSTGARSSGSPHAISVLLAACRGERATAEEQLRHARDPGHTVKPDDAVLADVADVAIAHSAGALHADYEALRRLTSGSDAANKYRALWLPLLAETLVERGDEAAASAALADLLTLADRVPYLRLTWHRLSGRLYERQRDPLAARRLYQAAHDLPAECFEVPLQTGLIEHCHGLLLCGLGYGDEGTALINHAVTRLRSAGAMPQARRAAADLSARHRAPITGPRHSVLTARERAVARLVAGGLTNTEAAASLYVSVKTIEYHLAQIYGKLGITSRRQLARFASTTSEFDDADQR